MKNFVIGIDIGTTGTKTVLMDAAHGIIAQATRESSLQSSRAGWAEADSQQWLRNIFDTVAEVLTTSGVKPADVVAVATSGMVPAILVLGADGQPLRPAILQNDARAEAEIQTLKSKLSGVDLVELTGSALTQQSVAPTAAWLMRAEPAVWEQTVYLVGSYDWALMALGAEPHVEQNWALESGLFTIEGEAVREVFAAAELEQNIIPPILRPGSLAGTLSPAAAERTGLTTQTKLIVGGADHVLSAFAAGVNKNGDWLVKLGGAGDILVASTTPTVDYRLYLDAHPVPGTWLPNGCMATSGSLIRWFQAIVGGEDLQTLDSEAMTKPPAQVLCLPYFLGEKSPLHDTNLRGTFAGLHLGHTRADLYRSVLESIAFGFRHHADVFRDIGVSLGKVMITNGGSKSTLWKQIHAEILGTEMYPVVDHPGASLGAALIAAVGVGVIEEWDRAMRFLRLAEPVVPNAENIKIYDQAYSEWLQLSETMTPISHAIAKRSRL